MKQPFYITRPPLVDRLLGYTHAIVDSNAIYVGATTNKDVAKLIATALNKMSMTSVRAVLPDRRKT